MVVRGAAYFFGVIPQKKILEPSRENPRLEESIKREWEKEMEELI